MREGLGSRGCIVCGRENAAGARVAFSVFDAGASRAEVVPPAHWQGFDGTLQGGMVAALLDDAMWYAAYGAGAFTMTAEFTVRFKEPVAVGSRLLLEGRVVERRRRLLEMTARLSDLASGRVLAEAQGKFLEVSEEMKERLAGGIAPAPGP